MLLTPGLWVLVLSVLSLSTLQVAADDRPCTVHADDKFYDLTQLKAG